VEEKENPQDEFATDLWTTYRVLDLIDGVYRVREYTKKNQVTGDNSEYSIVELPAQTLQTGVIPFNIAGSRSTDITPDDAIPLMPMAEHLLSAYMTSADYNQALHMSAQATPYIFGISEEENPDMIGAAAIIVSTSKDAKAGYMETSGNGIDALKLAVDNEISLALMYSHNLAERGKQVESGEALAIRIMTRTASLRSVILNGAYAFQSSLRHCADWVNADREQCIVTPNLEFTQAMVDAQMLTAFVNAVAEDAIPSAMMFDYLRKAGMTELDDIELEKLVDEQREKSEARVAGLEGAFEMPANDDGVSNAA